MEKTYNSMCIKLDTYDTEEAFWKAVAQQLKILTDNKYDVRFCYDDCGNYIIEYDYESFLGYGNDRLVWLTDDEAEDIFWKRKYGKEVSENE